LNNLLNIPHIYYINLDRSVARRNYVENHLAEFNIKNYTRVPAEDIYNHQSLSFLTNGLSKGLKPVEAVITLSHLKAIKEFLKSDQEWAIIAEDDLYLSFSNYWNFSWQDFFNKIPSCVNMVQLAVITRSTMHLDFHFHNRKFCDFSCAMYLINRFQANSIINYYCENEKINLHKYKIKKEYDTDNKELFYQPKYATAEEVVFGINKWSVYTAPIFGYTMEFESVENPEYFHQNFDSHHRVLEYWTNQHKNFSLDEFMRL
jgi:GR25 family glycosyltransferase involved in LPS biosynthesis